MKEITVSLYCNNRMQPITEPKPITHEMMKNKCELSLIEKTRFEYNYAIAQLTDESTQGDYDEINYLKQLLNDLE